jgi:hypothetical protein
VKIESSTGSGTGFIYYYTQDKDGCGIATAKHVIEDAKKNHSPLCIRDHQLKKPAFLPDQARVLSTMDTVGGPDSALIVLPLGSIPLQESLIPLLPGDVSLSIGTPIGWLGFPGIAADVLCFFSGHISARYSNTGEYLIDGVAINGVSRGPAFYITNTGEVRIIGIMTAYCPNYTTGDTLPGLSVVQDLSYHLQEIGVMRSIEELVNTRQKIEHGNGLIKINS